MALDTLNRIKETELQAGQMVKDAKAQADFRQKTYEGFYKTTFGEEIRYIYLRYADTIIALAKEAAVTGEPIIRYLEYVFPHEGLCDITDQFMVGDRILCAPVTAQDAETRTVVLPRGQWRYCDGTVYEGGCTQMVPAPLSVVPVFEKI